MKRTNVELVIAYTGLAVACVVMLVGLSGCQTIREQPNYIRRGLIPEAVKIELSHSSHATTGQLGCSQNCSEDALTTANLILEWRPSEHSYIQIGEGLNLRGKDGGGFYGPREVFTARAGYSFPLK